MAEYRLFLGNPGVGKSTIVNCMLGRPAFESGLSFGPGLTVNLQEHTADDGVVYLDTPGLADVAIRAQAAIEIEKALRKGGVYKLFFVTVLMNGRVSSQDIATFNQVVEAIDVPNIEFSVVINNIKPKRFKILTENEEEFNKVAAGINTMTVQTTSITLVPMLEDLDEETNAITSLPTNFVHFMNNAPSIIISPQKVRSIDIDADQFARQIALLQTTLDRIVEDNTTLRQKLQELERRTPGFRKSLGNAFTAIQRNVAAWF